jgi:hypothetical protein
MTGDFLFGAVISAFVFGILGFFFGAAVQVSGREGDREDDQHLYAEQRRAER